MQAGKLVDSEILWYYLVRCFNWPFVQIWTQHSKYEILKAKTYFKGSKIEGYQSQINPLKRNFFLRMIDFVVEIKVGRCFFFEKKLQKPFFLKIIFFSHFLLYLQKYFNHRDVQYLTLILRRHCFDHFRCIFALVPMVLSPEVKMCVYLFSLLSMRVMFIIT